MRRPEPRDVERFANDPLAERLDEPAYLGRRKECRRQLLAEFRMVHAHERLEACESPERRSYCGWKCSSNQP